ncbi:WG repeat-containing protein [Candidatus Obscuribacterales bacterium]|nr:WG repeat-containing protein [Candidatus Obscuribacterales bacterium]MBX3138751.1 WG repeat-containing protein [Candidatus Obscuribacterales bacterium]MBX3152644.1 WG repeat-containing protein [Candidatus Obscuribacterales bacterium]
MDVFQKADGWFLVEPHYLDKNHDAFLVNAKGQKKPASDESKSGSESNGTKKPSQERPPNLPTSITRCFFRGDEMIEIENSAGERGFCDKDGNILVPLSNCFNLQYLGSDRFIRESYQDDGLKRTELIASGGKVLVTFSQTIHLESHRYCDGLLRARTYGPDAVSICYFDESGTLAVEPGRFASGRDFHNGRAVVEMLHGGSKKAAFIDTSGEIVAGPFFSAGDFLNKTFAFVSVDETHSGIIDRFGKFVIEPLYTVLELQGDKLAGVKDGRWMLLSRAGELMLKLPPRVTFLDARSKDGLWIFGEGGSASDDIDILDEDNNEVARKKLGLMNSLGRIVLNAQFYEIENIGEGFARLAEAKNQKHELRWGVSNKLGKIVVPCSFSEIQKDGDTFIVRNKRPGGFDPDEWKRLDQQQSMNRVDLWRKFLDDYDVIGMDRSEIYRLLSRSSTNDKDEIIYFRLNSGDWCGNASRSIEFRLDRLTDKVTGWRERKGGSSMGPDNGWFTENAVYKCLDPERRYFNTFNIVPKYRNSARSTSKPVRSCF